MADLTSMPLINGARYDFTSLKMSIGSGDGTGNPIPARPSFTSLNFTTSIAGRENVKGNGSAYPVGQSQGTLEFTADFGVHIEDWNAIKGMLGAGWMGRQFVITAEYGQDPAKAIKVKILGSFTSEGSSHQVDGRPAVTINMLPLRITWGPDPIVDAALASEGVGADASLRGL